MSEKPTYEELEHRVRELEAAGDDQRRVEAELREIERSLTAIIHASPESAILMDRKGTVIRCNRVAGERLGLRWEEMIGRCIYDFLPPEVAASRRRHVEEAARSGEPIVFEDVRDGRFFSHHLHPVVDAEGNVDRVAIFGHDITEYRTSGEKLRRQNALLSSVRRAQALFISGHEPRQVYEDILHILVQSTGSAFGFLDEVLRDADGTPYKLNLAMSDVAWDEESRRLYEQLRSQNLEFRHLDNLAGAPVVEGRTIIAGDVPRHPLYRGLPQGHPVLTTYMGIPLTFGDELMGVAGVANRPGGYSEEIEEEIQPLIQTCAAMIWAGCMARRDREHLRALKASEEEYRTLFREMLDGFALHEIIRDDEGHPVDYRFLAVNPAFERMTGIRAGDVVGRTVLEALPGTEPYGIETCGRVASTGEPVLFEDDFKDVGKHVEVTVFRPAPGQFACIVQDVTERKQALEALAESERKWRNILINTPQIGISLDAHGGIVFANTHFLQVTGWREEDVLGRDWFDGFIPPEVRDDIRRVFRAVMEGEGVLDLSTHENEIVTRSGERRTVAWSNVLTRDAHGAIVDVTCLGVDLTERKQSEKALEDERAFLSAVFDNVEESIVICDEEGRLIRFNEAARRLHGLPEKPILPDQWAGHYDLYRLDGRTPLPVEETPLFRALRGEHVQNAEIIVAPRHDHPHLLVCSGQALTDETGRINGAVIAMHDITKRKRAEEALEFQRAQLTSLFDYSGEAIVLLDTNNHILNANTGFEHIFGYSPEEARGNVIEDLICPERFYLESKELDRRAENGIKGVELIRKRKDGKEIFVQVSAGPIEVNGSVDGRFVVFDDISERKMAEDALKQSERFLRQVIDASPNCIFIKDWDGRYVLVNKSIATLYGVSEEEMLGRTDLDLAGEGHLEQEEAERFLADDRDVIARHTKKRISEERLTMADGTERWFHTVKVPLPSDVMPRCMLGVATDITERKRAEEVRERLQSQLNQAQKMEAIGTLAGGIAHDFNNILSIIMGNTEMAMLDLSESSPARENLGEVREATLRARELVKQILLFARQKEPTITNLRLGPIVRESLKMLRASIPTTVAIQVEIDQGVPPVLADPAQIQQVIMNLCTNAGQVMEPEGGTLTLTLDSADLEVPLHTVADVLPSGRYVRMEVRDTGPGIPPENLERIFDPFFTTKGVGEGTGLGLSVVHGIVRDRKGGITVESEEGRGTTFTIYLPASHVPSGEVTAEQKRDLPRGTERVLFVDDEAMIRKLGQRMLERQGYMVETCGSGTEALECFRQAPHGVDLVITDMTMPGMRGDRLAEAILAIRPEIPVILCTGYSRQISEEKAQDMGIRALVMKPLTQHELASTVRRVLDEKTRK